MKKKNSRIVILSLTGDPDKKRSMLRIRINNWIPDQVRNDTRRVSDILSSFFKNMEQQLYDFLDSLEITYEKIEHEAFPTCEASGDFYQDHDLGADCKNIFMRNKKGRKHYLVVIKKEKNLDIPALAEHLEEHRKMGFASDERLEKFLGLQPGSVTPFSLINPTAAEVPVVVDPEIFEHEFVHFHPLRNTATLKISTKDFRKFLDNIESEKVLDFVFE